jgi:hypothetical protein
MCGSKRRFPQGGGVGVPDFGGRNDEKERGKRTEGLGSRIARVGDWMVDLHASYLRLLLLCAREWKSSASTCGATKRSLFARMGIVVSPVPKSEGPGAPAAGSLGYHYNHCIVVQTICPALSAKWMAALSLLTIITRISPSSSDRMMFPFSSLLCRSTTVSPFLFMR